MLYDVFINYKIIKMLRGKIKEQFEKWYFKNYCRSSMKYKDLLPHHKDDVFGWFYNQKVGLQRGVIIDFLDSIGIECFYQIGIDISNGSRDGVDYSIYFKDKIQYSGTGKTRIECFENSIKKVVELFNDGRFQNLV